MEENLTKWNQHCKDEPDIYHFNVSSAEKRVFITNWFSNECVDVSPGQLAIQCNKHGGQHKEGCKVDRDDGFKEEILEIVCDVADDDEKQGGEVCCHDLTHQPPGEDKLDRDAFGWVV